MITAIEPQRRQPLPLLHYVLFVIALLGHIVFWGLCRAIPVYPIAMLYCGIFYLTATCVHTLLPFYFSNLYFAREDNRARKWRYWILPVLSLGVAGLMIWVFPSDADAINYQQLRARGLPKIWY